MHEKCTCAYIQVHVKKSAMGDGMGVFARTSFEVGEELVRERPLVVLADSQFEAFGAYIKCERKRKARQKGRQESKQTDRQAETHAHAHTHAHTHTNTHKHTHGVIISRTTLSNRHVRQPKLLTIMCWQQNDMPAFLRRSIHHPFYPHATLSLNLSS
jgi:hypothetical protein